MFDTTNLYSFMDDPFRPEDEIYIVKHILGGNPAVSMWSSVTACRLRGLTSIYDVVGRNYTVGVRYRF